MTPSGRGRALQGAGPVLVASALLVTLIAAVPALASPPPIERLFGCPLLAQAESFAPDAAWQRLDLDETGVRVAVPLGWKAQRRGPVVELVAPDGKATLVLRRSQVAGGERLETSKRALEAAELGPSHLGAGCEKALLGRLPDLGRFEAVRLGVHGRPLGDLRRTYAVHASLGDATVTVLLTVRWGKGAAGPDLAVVRQVLGGVVPLARTPPAP